MKNGVVFDFSFLYVRAYTCAEARAWREAVAENQLVFEYPKKAAEAYALGMPEKTKEGGSWHNPCMLKK